MSARSDFSELRRKVTPGDKAAVAALVLICVLLFLRYFTTAVGTVPGLPLEDARTQWLCWREYGFGRISQGVLPLWNPHVLVGVPFVASFQSALFYPPNYIFCVLPVHLAANLDLFFHLLLSCLGTYLAARCLGIRPAGAVVSALAYSLGAPQFLRIYGGHWGAACATPWLPLLFVCVEQLLRRPGFGGVACGAGVLCMFWLAGAPQFVVFSSVSLALYIVMRGYCLLRADGVRSAARSAAALIVSAALGTLLAGVQLAPGFAAMPHLARSGPMLPAWSAQFALPAENLVTFILPYFFGGAAAPYWGKFNIWEMSCYIGALAFLLAVFGLAKTRKELAVPLGLTVLLSLLLALGRHTPLFTLLQAVAPGLRGASKFLTPATFFFALLAGYGCHALGSASRETRKKFGIVLLFSGGIVLFAGAVIVYGEGVGRALVDASLQGGERYLPLAGLEMEDVLADIGGSAFRGMTLFAVAGLAAILLKSEKRLVLVLALLFALDLVPLGSRYLGPRSSFRPGDRYWDEGVAEFFATSSPQFRVHTSGWLGLNDAMLYGVSYVEGIDPNPPKRFHTIFTVAQGLDPRIAPSWYQVLRPAPLWNALALKYFVVPRGSFPVLPGTKRIRRNERFDIYENPNALPRARILHEVEVIADEEALLKKVLSAQANTLFLEAPPPPPLSGEARTEGGESCRIVASLENEVVVECTLAEEGYLLLADSYFPGWRATSNGRELAVLRANYCLRAVRLGTGEHEVRFTYAPRSLWVGVGLSVAGLLGLCLCGWLGLHASRKRNRTASDQTPSG